MILIPYIIIILLSHYSRLTNSIRPLRFFGNLLHNRRLSDSNTSNVTSSSESNMEQYKITISGYNSCGAYKKAKLALSGIAAVFPEKFQITIQEYETKDEFFAFLEPFRESIGATSHKTSPIVWFEGGKYLGGRDDTVDWCRKVLSTSSTSVQEEISSCVDPWKADHGFDYDLIVIGGGSGGLACSKAAKELGANVAVLDFVKPSPFGSKWGLGGTCVNVGCIPKKLMHQAALLGEHIKDSKGFGWSTGEKKHDWVTLRDNVQDYIKGLNFGYRVQLREAGVTYLNKLGTFTGPNQMEVKDSKGRVSNISAARFVIATGGRPTPLSIPGAEYAISSDDLFMLERPPGDTLVIGGGYVAAECAGFLAGLGHGSVTLIVRSVLLRTFDRDTIKYIQDYMIKHGVNIIEGVLPKSIEKLPNGRFLVHYGDTSGEFDTVLQAVGRTPDLTGLNLPALNGGEGLKVDEKSGKIVCHNEQTSIPHVYAVGDVVHGAPELTPSAILAGKLLSGRLFGEKKDKMNYKHIPTAVFTPLELGTIGLSEEEAIEIYGENSVESFLTSFTPLEWSITENYNEVTGYAKIVVLKDQRNLVVGIHIASPNAGEVIQGFGLAVKKGLYYEDLKEFVGIHPTIGEELTIATVTKSSGATIVKSGC